MERKLGRSAASGGGVARICQSVKSETAKVPKLMEYASAGPAVAAITPPNDGPAIPPMVLPTDRSAETAGISPGGRSLGVRASSDGRLSPLSAANAVAHTNRS